MDKIELGECEYPQYSVIWLHGLGADGHDFAPIIPELNMPSQTHFVFPHAPYRPVTMYGDSPMRAWFDLLSLNRSGPVDEAGILESIQNVHQLIDAEIAKGVKSEHIILAGFSQGGAIAILAGLLYPQRLGGIIGLSTFLAPTDRLDSTQHQINKSTPIFVGHGSQDSLVSPSYGKDILKFLTTWGNPVSWHEYPMPHSVCKEEIEDIAEWLKDTVTFPVGESGRIAD